MKSKATRSFWKLFDALPTEVREQARRTYHIWLDRPNHPGLHFKRVSQRQPIYSVRIGRGWRALGLLEDDGTIYWFWIGPHGDYDAVIARL